MAVEATGPNIKQTVVDFGTIMQRVATQPRGWDIAEPAFQQLIRNPVRFGMTLPSARA